MTAVDISILGCRFYDDDATTQVEGIYMQGATSRVLIDDNNFTGSTQATRNSSTGTGIRIGHKNIGSNLYAHESLSVATVTTAETTMHAITFLADEISTSTVLEYDYYISDTLAGVKTYRLKLGSNAHTFASITPAIAGIVRIHGFVRFATTTSNFFTQLDLPPASNALIGQIKTEGVTTPTLTASWIFSLTAESDNASGSCTIKSAFVRPV